MKKTMIGIGALIVALVVIGATSQFKAGKDGGLPSSAAGPSSSCCPLPAQTSGEETAVYKCESCGRTYEKAGDCCGKPTKKVE